MGFILSHICWGAAGPPLTTPVGPSGVLLTAGQKGGGVRKWTSVTPRGRKPIFPHPRRLDYAASLCPSAAFASVIHRRRMMMTSGERVKYRSSLDCARQILRTEGVLSFYKGV